MSSSTEASAQRRPASVACSTCRRAKMKCVTSDGGGRCDRCVKWNKDCVFEAHRRGQWRRDPQRRLPKPANEDGGATSNGNGSSSSVGGGGGGGGGGSSGDGGEQMSNNPHLSPLSRDSGDLVPRSQHDGGDADILELIGISLSSIPFDADLLGEGEEDEDEDEDEDDFFPPAFVSQVEDARGLSLDFVLDPDRGPLERAKRDAALKQPGANVLLSVGPAAPTPRARSGDDPIDRGILSVPAALHLFEGYFKHFNYLVGALDPDLYTFAYTRAASSLLFTVVLSISSRVFRPELRPALRDHAETLLGKALLACDPSIENILSLICLYYWKDVGDKRGYSLVGFALRMASSADWYTETQTVVSDGGRRGSDPEETELQFRQKRDKERVWLCLGNLDRSSSYFTSRPLSASAIVGDTASRGWLNRGPWTYPNGDSTAVSGNELNLMARPVYEFIMSTRRGSTASDPPAVGQVLDDDETFEKLMAVFNEKISAWGETWGPVYAKFPQPQPCLEHLVYTYQEHVRLYFNSIRLHRILAANNSNVSAPAARSTIDICFASAVRLLRQSLAVGKMDVLYYCWDTNYLMTAYSAMMLLKILKIAIHLPESSVKEAFDLFVELAGVYTRASASLSSSTSSSSSSPRSPSGRASDDPQRNPAENAVDAQARLLRGIVERIKTHILPRRRSVLQSGRRQGAGIPGQQPQPQQQQQQQQQSGSPPLWQTPPQQQDMISGNPFAPDGYYVPDAMSAAAAGAFGDLGGVDMVDPGMEGMGMGMDDASLAMAQLVDEMDFSLDAGFVDSRFMDAGLLSWDAPGIFIGPR